MIDFGKELKRIRKERGLSQQDLANKLGISRQAVAQYERRPVFPRHETLLKIAAALDVSIFDLLKIPESEAENLSVSDDGRYITTAITSETAETMFIMNKLNRPGQKRVRDYASDLAENPKYQKAAPRIHPIRPEVQAAHYMPGHDPEGDAHDDAIMDDPEEWT